jgi:transposase-like protein
MRPRKTRAPEAVKGEAERRRQEREAKREAALFDLQAGDSTGVVGMRYGIHPKWIRKWRDDAQNTSAS